MFTKKEAELIKQYFEIKPAKFTLINKILKNEQQVQAQQEIVIKDPMIKKLTANNILDARYLYNFLYPIIINFFEDEAYQFDILEGNIICIGIDNKEIVLNDEITLLDYSAYFVKLREEMFKKVEEILKAILPLADISFSLQYRSYEYKAQFDIDEHTEKDEKYFNLDISQDMNETKLKE